MTVMLHYLSLLERQAVPSPLIVIVDDLQSADADSARLFQFLARNTKGLPVMLVAALETEGDLPSADDGGSELLEVLQSLEREGMLSTIKVEGLRREQIRQVAENFGGASFVSSPLLEELLDVLERAGGNPYHVLSTIRGLAESGQLSRHRDGLRLGRFPADGGPIRQFDIPSDARAAVERRMQLLTDDERSVVHCAAVLGPEFRMEPIAAALGKDFSDAVRLSARLTSEYRFLRPPSMREGLWAFTHPLTWHAVLESEKPSERTRRAQILAQWWSKNRPNEVEEVAHLYYLAGDESHGRIWAERALDEAFKRGSSELVERSFRWLQKLSINKPIEERLTQGIEVYDRLFRTKGTSSVTLRVLDSLRPLGDSSPECGLELESRLTVAVCHLRGPAEARKIFSKSAKRIRLLRAGTPSKIAARMKLAEGVVNFYEARDKRAERALKRAETTTGTTELRFERCYVLYLLGSVLISENRLDQARQVYSELVSANEGIKGAFPRVELFRLALALEIAQCRGAVAESIRTSESIQSVAWENDDVNNASIALTNIASLCNDAHCP